MSRSLLIASALITCGLFVAPATRAGEEVSVPKDAPVFKVTMPDGWKAKDALSGISPQLSNEKGLVVDFKKLSNPDGKAGTEAAAKERVEYDPGKQTDEPIAELPEQVAGNKAYQMKVSSLLYPPDRYTYKVVGFTLDGKTYYAAVFNGDEKIVNAGSEDIAAILASITAAK